MRVTMIALGVPTLRLARASCASARCRPRRAARWSGAVPTSPSPARARRNRPFAALLFRRPQPSAPIRADDEAIPGAGEVRRHAADGPSGRGGSRACRRPRLQRWALKDGGLRPERGLDSLLPLTSPPSQLLDPSTCEGAIAVMRGQACPPKRAPSTKLRRQRHWPWADRSRRAVRHQPWAPLRISLC